ncbi:MAG: heavy metal translocating P-type ATPase [Clostridiaceae bacterium]
MGRVRKEFILDNLNCAHCAGKIEESVNLLKQVEEASFDFVSKRLILYGEEDVLKEIDKEIKIIVASTEPDVKVIERNKYNYDFKDEEKNNDTFFRFAFGSILFTVASFIQFSGNINILFFILTYLIAGYDVLIKCFKNISKGDFFDENFLMSIATVGAFLIGDFPEGAAVMLFYKAGEMFQDMSINNSRKSIRGLLNIKAEYANLLQGEKVSRVSPEDVKVGEIILIKPGERVPLDGIVVEGKSNVDTSAITGESAPKSIKIKDEILSGYINVNGVVKVKVIKKFENSTVSKIMDLVENASTRKAKTENFITKFAKIYTPFVVVTSIAIALIPTMFFNGDFHTWIYRGLVFLVVSCPCALVISIPLGFFGGIGLASKNGILIKGSNYLEGLNSIEAIVFDKTGTLTEGNFKVSKIQSFNGYNENQLLEIAASGEYLSNHIIARAIVKEYNKEIEKGLISNYTEIAGMGIRAYYKGAPLIIGNSNLMKKYNIVHNICQELGTIVYIALKNVLIGIIVINDEIKKDSKRTIEGLESFGISNIIMLSGDNYQAAQIVGKKLGIKDVHSELLPSEKVDILEKIMKDKTKNVVFVGDGINDAPVLARSNIGISMGALGSDAAVEASDIVLMVDEPSKILTAIKIARFTRKIVSENIVFALGVKLLVLILGIFGVATMWEAVFADVGVAVLAVLNSIRGSRANL